MRFLVLLSLTSLLIKFHTLAAQERIYLDSECKRCKQKHACYYRIISGKDASGKTRLEDYYMDGTLQMSGTYSSLEPDVKEGLFKYYTKAGVLKEECSYLKDSLNGVHTLWNKNGKLREKSNYVMSNLEGELLVYDTLTGNVKARENYRENKLDGSVKTYYRNGKLSSERVYEKDKELESHCFTQEGMDTTCNIYNYKAVFKHSIYSSHIEYFKENFVRPNISKSKMAGKYKIMFVIRSDGGIETVNIVPKPVTELDEALSKFVMESGQYFIPAYHRGVRVKSKLAFDMIFIK
jgi:hypothetical protein